VGRAATGAVLRGEPGLSVDWPDDVPPREISGDDAEDLADLLPAARARARDDARRPTRGGRTRDEARADGRSAEATSARAVTIPTPVGRMRRRRVLCSVRTPPLRIA